LSGPVTSAAGSGSVAIAGDVPGVVIAGDHNEVYQYLVQHYPSLKDFTLDFDAEKRLAERFVGRDELFRRVDDFTSRPCGYFRVVADAGLGKTALAAAAARRLKAPAFFANASGGRTWPDQCLNHLAVALIARFGLAHDHLPARSGESSDFLGKVLAEAAVRAEGPLWLVVDALDEADPPGPGRNPLLLPDRLPRGVFVLLTHRPDQVALATAAGTAQEEYAIAWNDDAQQADIEAYLRQEADRPEIRRAREAVNPRITVDRFVAFLKDKSEGNFKYLDYVLADIAAREPGFDPLDLEALPSGLRGYYQLFWSQMEQARDREGWAEWADLYRPTISLLAAAREAVPVSWLGAMTGRPAAEIEERALQRWQRFLGQEGRRGSGRWRVVHQSFVDFLVGERKVDLRAAHDRVASFYLCAWGGLDTGLPALFDPARGQELDRYGLRHLAEHVERAGRIDDLHRLLRLERRVGEEEIGAVRTENVWYAARERVGQTEGYMNDLARAARLAQVADRTDIQPSQLKTSVGLGIRYALMSTSLNNLARNIPPTLIAALVEKRIWLVSQGLAYARVLPPETRVNALIGISSQLDPADERTVLQEALDTARGIGSKLDRARALTELGQMEEALAVAGGIGDEGSRARALAEMAPRLADLSQVREMLGVARKIGDKSARARVLADVAPRLAALGQVNEALAVARGIGDEENQDCVRAASKQGQLDGALTAARETGSERARARVLAELGQVDEALAVARGIGSERARARALAELGQMDEALAVARGIGSERARARALVDLVPRLGALGQMEQALAVARGIGAEGARARALAALDQVEEALTIGRGIEYEGDRARTLADLAPYLAKTNRVEEALAIARAIGSKRARARALAALAPCLAALGRVEEALAVARGIGFERARARALADLGQVEEALAVERVIGDDGARARALAALAPCLAETGTVEEALAMAQAIVSKGARARALAALAPRLAALGRVEDALAVARAIRNEEPRAGALAELGQVDEALAVVRGIGSERARARAQAALARLLAAWDRVGDALSVAREIGSERARDHTLADVRRLESERRIGSELVRCQTLADLGQVDEALFLARGIRSEGARARTLADLGQVDEALAVARGIGSRKDRARALADLVPHLVALGRAKEALAVAQSIRLKSDRAGALAFLGRVEEALALAWGIRDAGERADALTTLSLRLRALPYAKALPLWVETLRLWAAGTRRELLDALTALASFIAALGGPESVEETCRAIEDVGRWWP
jgi:hypothetical protein